MTYIKPEKISQFLLENGQRLPRPYLDAYIQAKIALDQARRYQPDFTRDREGRRLHISYLSEREEALAILEAEADEEDAYLSVFEREAAAKRAAKKAKEESILAEKKRKYLEDNPKPTLKELWDRMEQKD